MRAAIITLSDAGYAGRREDKSGPAIRELVEAAGYEDKYTLAAEEALKDAYLHMMDQSG